MKKRTRNIYLLIAVGVGVYYYMRNRKRKTTETEIEEITINDSTDVSDPASVGSMA